MPRDAQAMMVTLFAAAHLNRHGIAPTEPVLEKLFDLSESILKKAEERERKREDALRAAEQRPAGG